jgi:hypothetical protein
MKERLILPPDDRGFVSARGCRMRPGLAVVRETPVLSPTLPCEGVSCYVYGSVIRRGGWYRIWHQAVIPNFGDAVCHSISRDGIEWRRPLFGGASELKDHRARHGRAPTVDSLSFPEALAAAPKLFRGRNNIAACLHNPVVIPPDEGDPYPGLYKIFGFTGQGYVAGFSKDGRKFRYAPENPVIPLTWRLNPNTGKRWANDVGIPFWDGANKRYVGLIKTYEIDKEGRTRRCIGYAESPDLLRWTPVETVWTPGEAEDAIAASKGFHWADLYGLPAFPYGDGYLGFLWLFMIDYELPKGTHVGKIEVYLAWSRDGRRWERVSDEPLLPNRPDGEWMCGTIHTASRPVRESDHEKIYFGASSSLHGGWEVGLRPLGNHPTAIGVASLPKNGFCRVWAEDGEFIVPLGAAGEARRVSITFSREGGGAFAEARQPGAERALFGGPVSEGERITFCPAKDERRELLVTLKNCGVYAIEIR